MVVGGDDEEDEDDDEDTSCCCCSDDFRINIRRKGTPVCGALGGGRRELDDVGVGASSPLSFLVTGVMRFLRVHFSL